MILFSFTFCLFHWNLNRQIELNFFFFFFFFFNSVLRPFQDHFSTYEKGQSVGGAKTGEPREKPPDTPASRTWLVSQVASAENLNNQNFIIIKPPNYANFGNATVHRTKYSISFSIASDFLGVIWSELHRTLVSLRKHAHVIYRFF